jgi:hypothetical protein
LLFPERHTLLPMAIREKIQKRQTRALFSMRTIQNMQSYLSREVD